MHKSFNRVRRTFDTLRSIMRARREQRHLHELPDYLLDDIGLGRSEISSVKGAHLFDDMDGRGSLG